MYRMYVKTEKHIFVIKCRFSYDYVLFSETLELRERVIEPNENENRGKRQTTAYEVELFYVVDYSIYN